MIPLSLQLYTIRQTMQQDVAAGLKQASAAGYTGVEFAGYYDIPAGEMRQLLEQNQLRPVSSHISLEQLQDNLDFHINYLQQLGCDFLVCPWAQMENVQQAAQIGEQLRAISERCAMAGINLGYHNHTQEFKKAEDGRFLFDHLMDATGPLVFAELDVAWITHENVQPIEIMRHYAGRIPLLHLKQINADKQIGSFNQGTIDFGEIIKAGNVLGVEEYIVEQDACDVSLQDIKDNFQHIQQLKGV